MEAPVHKENNNEYIWLVYSGTGFPSVDPRALLFDQTNKSETSLVGIVSVTLLQEE